MEVEQNVDAMIDEAYQPESPLEAPSESEGNADSSPQQTNEPELTPDGKGQFLLKYKGKELTLDEDKARAYAQKGYDYEQKMHQFRVDRKLKEQEWETKTKELQELQEINAFAKENPAFEQLIQREWAKVQSGQQINVSPEDKVSILESRLNQVLDKLNNHDQINQQRQIAEMEAKQEGSIEKYKEQFSDFDWESKDESGATLEDRIMQSMLDNGVKDFEIMANSFLMKEHMNRKSIESKEQVAKKIQAANKLGLGKVTKKSQLGATKAEDIGKKSYDDLVAEGLAELGINY